MLRPGLLGDHEQRGEDTAARSQGTEEDRNAARSRNPCGRPLRSAKSRPAGLRRAKNLAHVACFRMIHPADSGHVNIDLRGIRPTIPKLVADMLPFRRGCAPVKG